MEEFKVLIMKMKNLMVLVLAVFALAMTNKTVSYQVDAKQSDVVWVGRKVTGEHTGHIKLTDGKLFHDGKTVTGGSFSIDMNSMTNTDVSDAEYKAKLIGHLKSDDFFSVEKYPTADFVITKVSKLKEADKYKVGGNLTIKGISKPIEFPATITAAGEKVTANATIKVDRAKYDVRYGSGSFFDDLGDKAIDDIFELQVKLVAGK